MQDPLFFRCAACGGLNRIPAARRFDAPTCGRCKAKLDTTGHPQDVSDDALARLVASAPVPVLVDFWAPWCGPCRQFAPVLAEFAVRRAGALIVVKLDTEQHARTAGALGVRSIPTLVLYKDGEVVFRQPGALMGAQLEAVVSPHL